MTENALILPLNSADSLLETAGGKARHLAALACAGFNVPAGFIITTGMYHQYLTLTGIGQRIDRIPDTAFTGDPAAREKKAAEIHALFKQHPIPEEQAAIIGGAYDVFVAEEAVAVRSSAVAEDLPGSSFAGQMETILNVQGQERLLEAVRLCWASLWTARLFAYREQRQIPHTDAAMAVIVQKLVVPQTAGVLFTANPLTGCREEMLITAGYGLGEAVVSGIITPDTFRINREHHSVAEQTTGSQTTMIVPETDGGTSQLAVPRKLRAKPALTTEQISCLVELGEQVEKFFDGEPQDIEWCCAENRLFLLQARPVTGLKEEPALPAGWEPPINGSRWIRRQVTENMPDPLSPLFDELYLREGLDKSLESLQRFMKVPPAMDRIYNKPMFGAVNGYAYMRADMNFTPGLIPIVMWAMARGVSYMLRGGGIRYWKEQGLPEYLAQVAKWRRLDIKKLQDTELIDLIRAMALADAVYWYAASLAFGTAKVTEGLLDWFLKKFVRGRNLITGMFLRGFSSRTLEMQTLLERIAEEIKADPALSGSVLNTEPENIMTVLAALPGSHRILADLERYFELYGHQTYTIDFAEPVLADTPGSVLGALQALVRAPGNARSVEQEKLAEERKVWEAEVFNSVGPLRQWLFGKLLTLAHRYAPYREESLFYAGYAWPLLRKCAGELGERLVKTHMLSVPDDVYYLYSSELAAAVESAAAGRQLLYPAKYAKYRRQLREARKQLHPPGAVPENYLFRMGKIDLASRESQVRDKGKGPVMRGFAISPGRITAPACVIRSPAEFNRMRPGTILVCAATTPAWTPLFTQAVGLVTDMGGVLAHGSIVAREFGLPAVMGTGNATIRIKDGQLVTVDGTQGVVLLEPPADDTSHPELG